MSVAHYNVVEFTAKLAKNTASLDTLHVMCPPPPNYTYITLGLDSLTGLNGMGGHVV